MEKLVFFLYCKDFSLKKSLNHYYIFFCENFKNMQAKLCWPKVHFKKSEMSISFECPDSPPLFVGISYRRNKHNLLWTLSELERF